MGQRRAGGVGGGLRGREEPWRRAHAGARRAPVAGSARGVAHADRLRRLRQRGRRAGQLHPPSAAALAGSGSIRARLLPINTWVRAPPPHMSAGRCTGLRAFAHAEARAKSVRFQVGMDDTQQNPSSGRATPLVDRRHLRRRGDCRLFGMADRHAAGVVRVCRPAPAHRHCRLARAARAVRRVSFSISDTFSIAAALLIGPAAGALTAAVDGLMLSFRMQSSNRTPRRHPLQPGGAGGGRLGGVAGVLRGWPARRSSSTGRSAFRACSRLLILFGMRQLRRQHRSRGRGGRARRRKSPIAIWREHFSACG